MVVLASSLQKKGMKLVIFFLCRMAPSSQKGLLNSRLDAQFHAVWFTLFRCCNSPCLKEKKSNKHISRSSKWHSFHGLIYIIVDSDAVPASLLIYTSYTYVIYTFIFFSQTAISYIKKLGKLKHSIYPSLHLEKFQMKFAEIEISSTYLPILSFDMLCVTAQIIKISF